MLREHPFQECQDLRSVLEHAGLDQEFSVLVGRREIIFRQHCMETLGCRALALAYRTSRWDVLDHGSLYLLRVTVSLAGWCPLCSGFITRLQRRGRGQSNITTWPSFRVVGAFSRQDPRTDCLFHGLPRTPAGDLGRIPAGARVASGRFVNIWVLQIQYLLSSLRGACPKVGRMLCLGHWLTNHPRA